MASWPVPERFAAEATRRSISDRGGHQEPIDKSAYATTTAEDGTYSIPFAPGTFVVRYSKGGMTTATVELDIQGEVVFPDSPVELYPVLTEPGLGLLTQSGIAQLQPVEMEVQKIAKGFFDTERKILCPQEGSLTVSAGSIALVDSSPSTMLPAKVGGYGLIFHQTNSSEPKFNGVFKDNKKIIGEEAVVLRTFDAEPGNYAYVGFSPNSKGELDLDAKQPCFPFKVQ